MAERTPSGRPQRLKLQQDRPPGLVDVPIRSLALSVLSMSTPCVVSATSTNLQSSRRLAHNSDTAPAEATPCAWGAGVLYHQIDPVTWKWWLPLMTPSSALSGCRVMSIAQTWLARLYLVVVQH